MSTRKRMTGVGDLRGGNSPTTRSQTANAVEPATQEEALFTEGRAAASAAVSDAQCAHIKKDGTSCQAYTVTGSAFCFFHDPGTETERTEASRAGGKKGRMVTLPPHTPDIPLETPGQVVRLLAETINQVRRGEIDSRTANTVGYLTGPLMKALEQNDLEKRITSLENALKKRNVRSEPVFGICTDSQPSEEEVSFDFQMKSGQQQAGEL